MVRVDDSKVALKTGFGKYVELTPSGELVARADAVGPREYWEPVFQEVRVVLCHFSHNDTTFRSSNAIMLQGKAALCGSNGLFLTLLDDESIACKSQTEGSHEFLCVRDYRGLARIPMRT